MTAIKPLILFDRLDLQKDATRSKIYIQDALSKFVALEDIVRPDGEAKVPGETAIPAGIYLLDMRESATFSGWFYTKDDINLLARKEWEKLKKAQRDLYHKHDVIHVDGVSNFSGILHHWGNTAADTRGCGLIGSSWGKLNGNTAVLASKVAYAQYYATVAPLIRKQKSYIEYRNSFAMAA